MSRLQTKKGDYSEKYECLKLNEKGQSIYAARVLPTSKLETTEST